MLFTSQTTRAMYLAEHFHAGQVDKSGAPVLFHVFRVADAMDTEEETIAALLHDTIEDTEAMLADFDEFPKEVTAAIQLLTRSTNETYDAYIRRLKPNDIARKVKIADIMDHLSLDRAEFLTVSMEKRYRDALHILLDDRGENWCGSCRHYVPADNLSKMTCSVGDDAFDAHGVGCTQFLSQYIQYPITVTHIDNNSNQHFSLHKCGTPVKVRPCSDNPENKTYFGILLGELPYSATCSHNSKTGVLTIRSIDNPAIFIPKLNKVVYGCESWWAHAESPEDAEQIITDDDIENTWYIKLLRDIQKS